MIEKSEESEVLTEWDIVDKIASQNSKNMVIKNTSLFDKEGGWDILICDGIISTVTESLLSDNNTENNRIENSTTSSTSIANNINIIDGSNKITIPGLVDAHVHLDKCFLLDRCCAVKGTVDIIFSRCRFLFASFPI